jgi:ribosome-binding protein aMBF1 (putative translation factor)
MNRERSRPSGKYNLAEQFVEVTKQAAAIAAAFISAVDAGEFSNWAPIIEAARRGGLTRDQLCRELSCAASTISRWEAGDTAPGRFARESIKELLLKRLRALQEGERLGERVGGGSDPSSSMV